MSGVGEAVIYVATSFSRGCVIGKHFIDYYFFSGGKWSRNVQGYERARYTGYTGRRPASMQALEGMNGQNTFSYSRVVACDST